MANILTVTVIEAPTMPSADTYQVRLSLVIQEGSNISDFGPTYRTIGMKTLGLYCTTVQLNNKILDAGEDFASDQGHGNTWTVRYLVGGFGQLA